jgi:hypothetical protein
MCVPASQIDLTHEIIGRDLNTDHPQHRRRTQAQVTGALLKCADRRRARFRSQKDALRTAWRPRPP